MIKKLISIVLGVLLSCGVALSMVGCHFHADPPKSIVIDGETYVTGFYNAEYFQTDNTKFEDYEKPLFTKHDCYWYKILDTKYEMYGCNSTNIVSWRPQLYCKESEFEEVKAYYEDINNYTYSFRKNFDTWIDIPDSIDKEKVESAMQEAGGCDEVYFNPPQGKNYPTFSATWMEFDTIIKIYIRTMSSDDSLYAVRFVGFYLNEQLCYRYSDSMPNLKYLLKGILQGKNADTIQAEYDKLPEDFYILNNEIHTYIVDLFEKYALEIVLGETEEATVIKKPHIKMR